MAALALFSCGDDDDESSFIPEETLPLAFGIDPFKNTKWNIGSVGGIEFGSDGTMTQTLNAEMNGIYIYSKVVSKYSYNTEKKFAYTTVSKVYMPSSVPTAEEIRASIPVSIESDGILVFSREEVDESKLRAYTLSEAKDFAKEYAKNIVTAYATGLSAEQLETYVSENIAEINNSLEKYFSTQKTLSYEFSTAITENDTLKLKSVFTGIDKLGNTYKNHKAEINSTEYDIELYSADKIEIEVNTSDYKVKSLATNTSAKTISGKLCNDDDEEIGTLSAVYELNADNKTLSLNFKTITASDDEGTDYNDIISLEGKTATLNFDDDEISLAKVTE